jgi:hypothetical protein
MAENYLYYDDNLDILRRYVRDEIAKLLGLNRKRQHGVGAVPPGLLSAEKCMRSFMIEKVWRVQWHKNL